MDPLANKMNQKNPAQSTPPLRDTLRVRTFKNDIAALQQQSQQGKEPQPEIPLPKAIVTPNALSPQIEKIMIQEQSKESVSRASHASFPEPQEQKMTGLEMETMISPGFASYPEESPFVQSAQRKQTEQNPFMSETGQQDQPLQKPTTAKNTISPIHTYTSDVAEAVKKDHTSVATIAVAENNRKIKEQEKESGLNAAGKNIIVILISIILLLIAAGITYYFLFIHQPQNTKPVTVTQAPTDMLGSEQQTQLPISSLDHDGLLQAIQKEITLTVLPPGQIDHITMTETNAGVTTEATTPDLFALLQTSIPDALLRSFDNTFYFGIHSLNGTNQPFLILTSNSYPATSAGMLTWESTMIKDLQGVFLIPSDQLVEPFFTENASSTQYTFQDAIIENKDVRLVRDSQGNIIFLYSLIDPQTLIITTNQYTFQELLDRLVSATFVR